VDSPVDNFGLRIFGAASGDLAAGVSTVEAQEGLWPGQEGA